MWQFQSTVQAEIQTTMSELVPYTEDHLRIKKVLIQVAKRKSVINYTDLLKRSGVRLDMSNPYDRGVLGNLLGDISWNEVKEGGPCFQALPSMQVISSKGKGSSTWLRSYTL